MKISVNAEEYGLERKELAAAGVIKYQLEKMSIAEALAGLDNPAELLWELSNSITVGEFDTGNAETGKAVVDIVKSMDLAEVMDHQSEGLQRFLADCRETIERGKW